MKMRSVHGLLLLGHLVTALSCQPSTLAAGAGDESCSPCSDPSLVSRGANLPAAGNLGDASLEWSTTGGRDNATQGGNGNADDPSSPSPCGSGSTRRIDVSNARQLSEALDKAAPGDVIRLADGIYQDGFKITRSGREGQPIAVCGSRNAILQHELRAGSHVVEITADHVVLQGFTVRQGGTGVFLEHASHNVIANLDVHHTASEGIHMRSLSTYNVVRDSEIHDTGLLEPGVGEGIYVGSGHDNFDKNSDGEPDATNHNTIRDNRIYRTTAECIDLKGGTEGGLVTGNQIDGSGLSGENSGDTMIAAKGNDYVIENNTFTHDGKGALVDGIQVISRVDGYGNRNVFRNNTFRLKAPGYAIRFWKDTEGNVLSCDNDASGAALGLSNLPCANR